MQIKKYYIQTYGCQMNVADAEFMGGCLAEQGMVAAAGPAEADVVVISTCSVRRQAENRALSYIGRLRPMKALRPSMKIVVAGCMAERMGKELTRKFPYVDLVIGATKILDFQRLFSDTLSCGKDTGAAPAAVKHSPVAASTVIMRGCENFCSYCIVPYVRGKEVSRPAQEIVDEIRGRAAAGGREILLLGQNVNSYRDGQTDFADLLRLINDINDIQRIRFMTSHPKDLGDRLIEAMASLEKVCEHLHLPLQSGSDRILSAMNRRYTADGYWTLIEKLRKAVPGISVSTDILVGFPGETEEDFQQTLGLMREIEYDFLFAFKYSPRPGTAAATMDDTVTRDEKEDRLARVLSFASTTSAKKNATITGTVQEVLVDKNRGQFLEGRTRTNKKVFFPGNSDAVGTVVHVNVTEAGINSLKGSLCEN